MPKNYAIQKDQQIFRSKKVEKNPTRILRIEDVCQRTALSRSQIFRMVKARGFPLPVKLCLRASGWVEREVEQWLLERISRGR